MFYFSDELDPETFSQFIVKEKKVRKKSFFYEHKLRFEEEEEKTP